VVPQDKQRVLKARWVFRRKIDGDTGLPDKFKARWVAKGFTQREGIDFDELYAGVAPKDSTRVLFAIANFFDWELHSVDVKAAFLNGDLQEQIYLEPPEGSDIPSSHVCLLCKSLYGLKQAPRCYNKKFDAWLRSIGFTSTTADSCIYIRRQKDDTIVLSIHVDDQLIAGSSLAAVNDFKRQLNAEFECTDNGPVSYFLGFNVYRDRAKRLLYISQEHHLEGILDRFGLSTCSPTKTPLPSGFKPAPATDKDFTSA
jgi:hypothetical protein